MIKRNETYVSLFIGEEEGLKIIENFTYSILHSLAYMQTIALFYPKELAGHPILKENMSNIDSNLREWLKVSKIFKTEKRVMDSLYFDSEINKQKEILSSAELHLKKTEDELNKGISPYKWKIIEGFDNYVGKDKVRADYALFLKGK